MRVPDFLVLGSERSNGYFQMSFIGVLGSCVQERSRSAFAFLSQLT